MDKINKDEVVEWLKHFLKSYALAAALGAALINARRHLQKYDELQKSWDSRPKAYKRK